MVSFITFADEHFRKTLSPYQPVTRGTLTRLAGIEYSNLRDPA